MKNDLCKKCWQMAPGSFLRRRKDLFLFFCTLHAQITLVKNERASLYNSFCARMNTIELFFEENDFF